MRLNLQKYKNPTRLGYSQKTKTQNHISEKRLSTDKNDNIRGIFTSTKKYMNQSIKRLSETIEIY